jgi:hypothetical protein
MANVVAKVPRLIRGDLLKCVDGVWSAKDRTRLPEELLALGTTAALQRWKDGMPVETIMEAPGEPLPDVTELNAAVPEEEWEKGIDGKPRGPWQLNWVCYLLDPKFGDTYTFANATIGARIAIERLQDRVETMQKLHREEVLPVVKLGNAQMKTQFGKKLRPEFVVVEWRALSGFSTTEKIFAGHPPIGKLVAPPTVAEELNDKVPF